MDTKERERVIRNEKQDRERRERALRDESNKHARRDRETSSDTKKEELCCTHSCMGRAVGVACVRGLRVVMRVLLVVR